MFLNFDGIVILVGESGGGKSAIESYLEKNCGCKRVISYTSRDPRPGEVEGNNYFYKTREEMISLYDQGFFAEKTEYQGNIYAAASKDCISGNVIVVEPNGLEQIKIKPGLKSISFYIKADEFIRYNRMIGAGRDKQEVITRIEKDASIFSGVADKVDHVIDANRTIKDCADTIMEIVGGTEFLLEKNCKVMNGQWTYENIDYLIKDYWILENGQKFIPYNSNENKLLYKILQKSVRQLSSLQITEIFSRISKFTTSSKYYISIDNSKGHDYYSITTNTTKPEED